MLKTNFSEPNDIGRAQKNSGSGVGGRGACAPANVLIFKKSLKTNVKSQKLSTEFLEIRKNMAPNVYRKITLRSLVGRHT